MNVLPHFNQKHCGFAHFFVIAGVVAGAIVAAVGYYYYTKPSSTNYSPVIEKETTKTTVPVTNGDVVVTTKSEETTEDKTPEKEAGDKHGLYYKDEFIRRLKQNTRSVVRIENWLVYSADTNSDYGLYARNIENNETIQVMSDEEVRQQMYDHIVAVRDYPTATVEGLTSGYEKALEVFEGDVIYTLGSYLRIGFLFKLTPEGIESKQTEFFSNSYNNSPNIKKYGDDVLYFVSFGDACASSVTVSRFDYDKFVAFGEQFKFGTFENKESVGYYFPEKTYFYSDYTIVHDEKNLACGTRVYKNLKGMVFDGGDSTYLDEDAMPEKIKEFYLHTPTKRIYMLSETELYYYDLGKKRLVDVGTHNLKGDYLWLHKVLDEGGLCVHETLIDHTTGKTIEEESNKCKAESEYSISVQEQFTGLDLPAEYSLK